MSTFSQNTCLVNFPFLSWQYVSEHSNPVLLSKSSPYLVSSWHLCSMPFSLFPYQGLPINCFPGCPLQLLTLMTHKIRCACDVQTHMRCPYRESLQLGSSLPQFLLFGVSRKQVDLKKKKIQTISLCDSINSMHDFVRFRSD